MGAAVAEATNVTTLRPATIVRLDPVSDDGALVQRYLGGEETAFAELYERFYSRLVLVCHQRVADTAAAEDLAQEVFVRALEALDRFDVSRPLWPWLNTIARRIAIDHARTQHFVEVSIPVDGGLLPPAPPAHEVRIDLEDSLDRVNERHALALRLFYVEDWPALDVCRLVGINRNALDQLLHRARARLREEYERVETGVRGVSAFFAGSKVVAGFRARMRAAVEPLGSASATMAIEGAGHVFAAALIGLAVVGSFQPTSARSLEAGTRPQAADIVAPATSLLSATELAAWGDEVAPSVAPAPSTGTAETGAEVLAASSADLVHELDDEVAAPTARVRVAGGDGALAIEVDAAGDRVVDVAIEVDPGCDSHLATGGDCEPLAAHDGSAEAPTSGAAAGPAVT